MPGPPWVDDPASVPDEEILWRGVVPESYAPDPLTGKVLPSEGAFRGPGQVSMYMRRETSVAAMLAKKDTWRLWCLTAKQIREYGCIIVRDVDDDGNTAHVIVLRADKPGDRLTGGMATKMRRNGYWED